MNDTVLGIIAGSGALPIRLAEVCHATGRPFFVLAYENETDTDWLQYVPHAFVRHGAVGKALEHLRANHVQEIVMAGAMRRPALKDLRPDMKGAKLLARLGTNYRTGDDTLLSLLVQFLEEEGFRVVGAHDVLASVLAPEGLLGSVYPDRYAQADIERGVEVAKTLGALDVGQAVIVQRLQVLGVEALEGTDALIERCATLKPTEHGGVLIKSCKPGQETRVDLPTIGMRTIELLAEYQFSGVAVEAGSALILDQVATIRLADKLGLFILGYSVAS